MVDEVKLERGESLIIRNTLGGPWLNYMGLTPLGVKFRVLTAWDMLPLQGLKEVIKGFEEGRLDGSSYWDVDTRCGCVKGLAASGVRELPLHQGEAWDVIEEIMYEYCISSGLGAVEEKLILELKKLKPGATPLSRMVYRWLTALVAEKEAAEKRANYAHTLIPGLTL